MGRMALRCADFAHTPQTDPGGHRLSDRAADRCGCTRHEPCRGLGAAGRERGHEHGYHTCCRAPCHTRCCHHHIRCCPHTLQQCNQISEYAMPNHAAQCPLHAMHKYMQFTDASLSHHPVLRRTVDTSRLCKKSHHRSKYT